MENNLDRAIIIDFFGLPGSGKSTISHLLAERLRYEGYKVQEPTYYLDHELNPWIRKIYKLLIFFKYSITNPLVTIQCINIIRNHSHYGLSMLSQIVNIIIKLYYINNDSQWNYIIFDEGLTQSAISLGVNDIKNTYNDDVYKLYNICKNKTNVYRIYVKSTIDQALKNLNLRVENDSRVEKIDNFSLRLKMMTVYYNACRMINKDICLKNDNSFL